jgi:hypothetical protein
MLCYAQALRNGFAYGINGYLSPLMQAKRVLLVAAWYKLNSLYTLSVAGCVVLMHHDVVKALGVLF